MDALICPKLWMQHTISAYGGKSKSGHHYKLGQKRILLALFHINRHCFRTAHIFPLPCQVRTSGPGILHFDLK